MNYNEALDFINSRRKFQKSSSHERIRELLKVLSDPQKSTEFIHVVGTNGKGTVSTCLSEILIKSGYTVGLFTSPYIIKFEERIRVNGEYISQEELCSITSVVKEKILLLEEKGLYPTVFETTLAIALVYYKMKSCDMVVLEAGIGGKNDSTNVIDTPVVSVFTSISLDHTEMLGDTVKKIATEKSGIIKKGTVAVSYPTDENNLLFPGQSKEALDVINEKCKQTDVNLICPDASDISILKRDALSTVFTFKDEQYTTKLWGRHQVGNLVTAICAVQVLIEKGYTITNENVKQGILSLTMPGRTETVSTDPLVIIDGGHNENAMSGLRQSIETYLGGRKMTLVTAFMKDKDYSRSLGIICPVCDRIVFTQTDFLRGETPGNLRKSLKDFSGDVYECDNAEKALNKALKITDKKDAVVVCGSFYLASEIRKIFL